MAESSAERYVGLYGVHAYILEGVYRGVDGGKSQFVLKAIVAFRFKEIHAPAIIYLTGTVECRKACTCLMYSGSGVSR